MTEFFHKTEQIAAQFALSGEIISALPFGEGHINSTCLIRTTEDSYILQSINPTIFPDTEGLMQNVAGVTSYLHRRLENAGRDPKRETLTVIPTRENTLFFRTPDGVPYRVYRFIPDSVTYQTIKESEDFRRAATAFGDFTNLLADYPADTLHETIPGFHDTENRYRQLEEALLSGADDRKKTAAAEIAFALSRKTDAGLITGAIASGKIPLRVCHNDTKLNNVLFDRKTGRALCVVDLDTVMPGSLLFDFGDAIRFGTNRAAEDERDLSLVFCDLTLYRAFTEGYAEEMRSTLTAEELKLFPHAARLLTLECGIRFLTDYLKGDHYFRISRPQHNLDRCRTQFKLVADMENKLARMQEITESCVR